ncbi:hypothetical protein L1987_41898 [Smallanthus sonchifolius]|uniref:Uncharacterized protein n=1 Tax=Smallanthus sonchifolius TaxID=185202 RepID=A0ACB9GWF3_9ASTR|nr:hypothetical protein L1987_41898 [Smallanthus sonchifolius]
MSQRSDFKPSVESFASLLRILINNRLFNSAEKIRISMVKACVTDDDARFVLGFLRKMNVDDVSEEFKFKLSVRCYNTLLMCLSRFLMIDDMKCVFLEMLDDEVMPNIYTYNSMVNGYCKLGEVDVAGFALIQALCSRGSVEEAHELVNSLKVKGLKVNEVLYTTLIDGYFQIGKADTGLTLFNKMLINDCLPNSWTYNVLIHGLCKEDKIQEASIFIGKMIKVGFKPEITTFTILIEGLLKRYDFVDAHKVFIEIVSSGLKPDVCTYTSFILAYCSQGMLEKAEGLMNDMMVEGVEPDTTTYTIFIDSYFRAGKIDSAFDVLKRMMDAKCEPSHHTYAIIVKHLLVLQQREKVKFQNFDLNIGNVWKLMDFETAMELFSEMVKRGCEPNVKTFEALTFGLCGESRFEEACRLVSHMLTKGLVPNEHIYTSLVYCSCSLRMFDKALTLLNTMIENRILPHLESYKLLICGLYDEGKHEKGWSTLCIQMNDDDEIGHSSWLIRILGNMAD